MFTNANIGCAHSAPEYFEWLSRGWEVYIQTLRSIYRLQPSTDGRRLSIYRVVNRREVVVYEEATEWKEAISERGNSHFLAKNQEDPPFRTSPVQHSWTHHL